MWRTSTQRTGKNNTNFLPLNARDILYSLKDHTSDDVVTAKKQAKTSKIEEWMNCLRKIISLSPRFYLILLYKYLRDATSYDDDEAVVYNGKDGNYDVGDNDNNDK